MIFRLTYHSRFTKQYSNSLANANANAVLPPFRRQYLTASEDSTSLLEKTVVSLPHHLLDAERQSLYVPLPVQLHEEKQVIPQPVHVLYMGLQRLALFLEFLL